MSKIPIALSWSGGKDCSYALHLLQQEEKYEVKYLLSTCNTHTREINMHHLHELLIAAQAAAVGIPLKICYVDAAHNTAYEAALQNTFAALKKEGIFHVAFGDIFLQDLRNYREQQLQQSGMQCIFPLWQRPTDELLQSIIQAGFKAMICCVDAGSLPAQWLGTVLNETTIAALPVGIDPCGENGEYHTFCFDGPIFTTPLKLKGGAISSQRMSISANKFAIFSWLHIELSSES